MGLLDSLQDIGFGYRGPRGDLPSSGERYLQALQTSRASMQQRSSRRLGQALADLAASGTVITLDQMGELSKKYDVPLREVMEQAAPLNKQIETDQTKKTLHNAWQTFQTIKKNNPNRKITPEELLDIFEKFDMTESQRQQFIGGFQQFLAVQEQVGPQYEKISRGSQIVEKTGDKSKPFELVYGSDEEKDYPAESWMVNNERRVSHDRGKTYIGDDGKPHPMPKKGAYRFSARFTQEDLAAIEAQKRAAAELAKPGGKPGAAQGRTRTMKEIAESGTGPWATAAAAWDAVAGGIGLDKVIGKEGFFQDIQSARQHLRTIKQLGKTALMISSRGPIWEQKQIDKLFPNPSTILTNSVTEAKKFETVKAVMLGVKQANLKLMATAPPSKVAELNSSNIQIDQLLSLISDEKFTDESLPKISASATKEQQMLIYNTIEPGNRYIDPSGTKRIKE